MPLPTSPPPPRLDHTTYRIGRGETGVLTTEPYKSALLPHWRFKTPSIARTSSAALWAAFLDYESHDDFVGMDMARKFLQMGMTRAKRYANHKGGRKYRDGVEGGGKREVIQVGEWEGRREKEEASGVFRGVWERARGYGPYLEMKGVFLKRQKEWDRERMAGEGRETEGRKSKEDREGDG